MNLVDNKKYMCSLSLCLILILIFVFVFFQVTFADEKFNKSIEYVRQNDNREYADYYYIYYSYNDEKRDMINVSAGKVSEYDFIGVLQNSFSANHYRFYCKLKGSDTWELAYQDSKEYISCWSTSQYHGYDKMNGMDCYIHMFDSDNKDNVNISANFPIYIVDFNPCDYGVVDVINKLSGYSLADNVVFEKVKQKYEYSSDIEIPLMAQCQVNGDRFLFNCMQTESHNDYRLQINASVSLTPIYSNLTSKKYADTEQIFTSSKNEIGKYDNHETTFNVSFTTTDLLNGIDTSRTALGFKEFYNGYNILLPYKEATLSKIYFYARNVSSSRCSNWVKVTYDLIAETSTYEEVESVAGSDVPSDTKKDSSESYPDDYIYNDNEPVQDSNSGGIIGYIKSGLGLVGNNSIIALIGNTFSFLPKELTTLLLFGGALLVAVGIIKVVTR